MVQAKAVSSKLILKPILENSPILYPGYHLCMTLYKIFLYSIYEIDTTV